MSRTFKYKIDNALSWQTFYCFFFPSRLQQNFEVHICYRWENEREQVSKAQHTMINLNMESTYLRSKFEKAIHLSADTRLIEAFIFQWPFQ